MGYHMWMRKCNFVMREENHKKALGAIKSLAGQETITFDRGPSHFSWVDTETFLKAQHIEDALHEWRWKAEFGDNGDIVSIDFIGEKLGDCTIMFNAIAPYVEDESFIEMCGEDGYVWRWVFAEGIVKELAGRTVFNDS